MTTGDMKPPDPATRSEPDIDVDAISADTFIVAGQWSAERTSTNDHAKALINSALEKGGVELACPQLVGADRQTQGRGRRSNQWWGGAGALTFSVILRASDHALSPEVWPTFSVAVGGAICEAIDEVAHVVDPCPSYDVRLKWPNDVYLNGRKLAGVLVEVPQPASGLLVVGIGINVNNSLRQAPADLQQSATSLIDTFGEPIDRTVVLISTLRHLETDLRALAAGGDDAANLRSRWRQRCLLTGRTVTVDDDTRQSIGTAVGIDDDGALLLQTEAGVQRLVGGTVTGF